MVRVREAEIPRHFVSSATIFSAANDSFLLAHGLALDLAWPV